MNRRTALMLSMLGSLAPARLSAQTAGRKSSKTRDKSFSPVSREDDRDDQPAAGDEAPAPFPPEPGFQWKRYPIARYTRVANNQTNPQKAIIDWIFKRTGLAEWHGDKIAVLSASRTELRATIRPTCSSKSTRSSTASSTRSPMFSRFTSSLWRRWIRAGVTRFSIA